MPVGKAEIAKEIIALALGAAMGGAPRAGGSVASRILAGAAGSRGGVPSIPGISSASQKFMAKQYPEEFAPQAWHYYDVVNVPGAPNFNQLGKANEGTINEAGTMQDIGLHNRTITKYLRPGMNPREERIALQKGLEEEKSLPQFWNESSSRRPFSVSSSAVTGIRLTPDARIEVQWKSSPTWYTFKSYPDTRAASEAAQQLLKADSIGRAVMPLHRNGVPVKYQNPDIGWWNYANYDPKYAKRAYFHPKRG